MDNLAKYCEAIDSAPKWLKIVLALPGLDGIVYSLYRAFKDVHNVMNIVYGVLWFFLGSICIVGAVIDIVTLLVDDKIKVLCADGIVLPGDESAQKPEAERQQADVVDDKKD